MKKEKYTQCLMKGKNTSYMAWIPAQKAVKGKILKIKGITEKLKVTETYSTLPRKDVVHNESDYKNHRKATDI